jgi:hypothetical protein
MFFTQNEFRSAHYANKTFYFTFCDMSSELQAIKIVGNTHIEKWVFNQA